MLDLDAALGPFKTPANGGTHRQRGNMHSSRPTKDLGGPNNNFHRRAESAPALPPFDSQSMNTPSQSSMADVFEEEEEDDARAGATQVKGASTSSSEDEAGVGIQVVDSATSGTGDLWHLGNDEGLGIQRGDWQPQRPSTSYSNQMSRLSTSGTDCRGSSLIEETIIEEASPVEPVEIVQPEEEPRASSLTKSSDSSETPTLLGPTHVAGPDMTPETYQTSNFSSPDCDRRQASFDASRLGTAASSIADTRTESSSCMTGEPGSEVRVSSDDVPSLTSSRSTMLSIAQANHSRRDVTGNRTPSSSSGIDNAEQRRHKRGSIQSLSQLVGNPFASARSKDLDESRPKTAAEPAVGALPAKKKKEHRLKKLMFWKAKQCDKSALRSAP